MADEVSKKRGNRSTIRIDKSTVDAEPLPPRGTRTMLWDSELKGFGVRIAATGVKTYLLRYRMGGRDAPVRTVTIGQHGSPWTTAQARKHAADLLLQVRAGTDIVTERAADREQRRTHAAARDNRMFAVVVETWFEKHVQRDGLRSEADIRGVVDRDLKPAFANRTIDEITKKEIVDVLDKIGDRSGSAANKSHKWLRQIFNWLVDRGDLEHSPMSSVKRPFPENSRTRVLHLGEIVVLWVALDGIIEPFRSFYRLLILVGQRLRETSDAPWREFDLEADEWLLPEERTKARRAQLVPLPEQAVALISAIRPDPKTRVGLVFTTNGKTPISGFSKMKEAIDEAIAELIRGNEIARELTCGSVADWVVHDLRRSLATGCQALGVDLTHTEAILNHAVGKQMSGAGRIYHLHDYYNEKADALALWGALVEKAVAVFRLGDLDGVRRLDPARRAKALRRRSRIRRDHDDVEGARDDQGRADES